MYRTSSVCAGVGGEEGLGYRPDGREKREDDTYKILRTPRVSS